MTNNCTVIVVYVGGGIFFFAIVALAVTRKKASVHFIAKTSVKVSVQPAVYPESNFTKNGSKC
jgi:hypothetical protein